MGSACSAVRTWNSVPSGGNFDGAAGVVAALLSLAAFDRAGLKTKHDVSAIGFRGEESAWFSIHHIGSRAALGRLPPEELDTARRFDTKRSLAEHMAETGCDLDLLRRRHASLPASRVKAYVELHIEQGPVLVHRAVPVGIVTGIRGNARIRRARCIGEYAHSGAVPRDMRRDAVMAMAEFVHAADQEWERLEHAGRDLVLTFGKLHTDTALHGHNKVPGTVDFVVDARSHEVETLDGIEDYLKKKSAEIAAARGVNFEMSSRVAHCACRDGQIHPIADAGRREGVSLACHGHSERRWPRRRRFRQCRCSQRHGVRAQSARQPQSR